MTVSPRHAIIAQACDVNPMSLPTALMFRLRLTDTYFDIARSAPEHVGVAL